MKPQKEQITSLQITFMVTLFEIGSAPLFLLGSHAGQDAWMATAVGSLAGLPLLFLFFWIQSKAADRDWIGLLRSGFGPYIGSILGGTYSFYFAYQSMRNVRDLGELTKLILLPATPMFMTMLIFVMTGGYAVWKGIHVVFRLPEMLLPIVLFLYAMVIAVFFFLKVMDFNRLAPVMENGFWPIVQVAVPNLVSFPFGQTLVFLMFWSFWENKGIPVKQTLIGYLIVSLFLIFVNSVIVAVLSAPIASASEFPMLKAVHSLSSLRFVERLEILLSILLYVGLYMKMTVFFLCAARAMAFITKKTARFWTIPAGVVIFGASFIEQGYAQHFAIGLGPSLKVDVVFQVVVPMILICLLLLKGRKNRRAASGGTNK
ncbi:GerAB/ArcD/ProY family transporter [Paenibacillus physcomitrellae]|uniref:Germination protein GerKB n=1 Tax=Paenibacillus physcomitrellae TaxID=1619311 RepID=A0ABQ1GN42_9BACL|nr:endospore germination permease [Paenibacillus physcomitrellae]GGA46381.1 germination protein GerKB [Paenibacillus physcomitrellae]